MTLIIHNIYILFRILFDKINKTRGYLIEKII